MNLTTDREGTRFVHRPKTKPYIISLIFYLFFYSFDKLFLVFYLFIHNPIYINILFVIISLTVDSSSVYCMSKCTTAVKNIKNIVSCYFMIINYEG